MILGHQLVSASDAGNQSQSFHSSFHTQYELRTQSNLVTDAVFDFQGDEINQLLGRDLQGRVMRVSDAFVESLFPDSAFGFPINNLFIKNFRGTLITANDCIDMTRFRSESSTTSFLNTMVSTIVRVLPPTSPLKPLRYFSHRFSTLPLVGHPVKRKPDITLFRLIDGCTQKETDGMQWQHVQGIIEHTREMVTPKRMVETVPVKSYMTLSLQPNRDFFLLVCITGHGFRIIMIDREGQVQTEVLPFANIFSTRSTLIFFRMIMGLTLLSDELLGLDPSISSREQGLSSGNQFHVQFPPMELVAHSVPPSWITLPQPSVDNTPNLPNHSMQSSASNSNHEITSITIRTTVYPVVKVLFVSQALIGRSTRTFLVRLPDGKLGVLKDSWSVSETSSEASFLEGLEIPFCSRIIDQCLLRSTNSHRDNPFNADTALKSQTRQKRRVVTYPAGVPLYEFHSMWELTVAMLDVAIGMIDPFFFFLAMLMTILFQPSCSSKNTKGFIAIFLIRISYFGIPTKIRMPVN